jgi:hypothetical protein
MKHWLVSLWVLTLSACSGIAPALSEPAPQVEALSSSSDLGPAPELNTDIWFNTETPLRLTDLRGKVVLLEMWTFG